MSVINNFFRKIVNKNNRKKLKNKDFSLIANNCNGCILLHDLNLKYRSPFVNLFLKPKDFIKYLKNIEHYMNCELTFINEKNIDYPVGVLDDIKIYFVHYSSEEEAQNKWNERTKRINLNNIFVMMTERDGCTYEDLVEFDNLNYKNKVVYTHLPYSKIKSACYIKGFENDECVGMCYEFKNKLSGKRKFDKFDYISWFNNN